MPVTRTCRAASALALTLLAGMLVTPALPASATEATPAPARHVNEISGPDQALSAFASTASDGDLVVTAWHDLQFGGSAAEVAVAVSDDSGQSWTAPLNLSRSPHLDSGRAAVAVHGQQVWVAWHEGTEAGSAGAGNHDIWAARSDDGGRTWSDAHPVVEDGADSLFPEVAVHAGRAYVAWAGLDGRLHLASSVDAATWGHAVVAPSADSGASRTNMAVADGRLYLAWSGRKTESAPVGGVHVVRVDADHVRAQPVEVRGEGTVIDGLTIDAQGSTVVVGWTERATLSAPHAVRVAVSRDGGAEFQSPTTLTAATTSAVLADVLVQDGLVTAAFVHSPSGDQTTRSSRDGGRTWEHGRTLPPVGGSGGAGQLSGPHRDSGDSGPRAAFDYRVPDRFGSDDDGDGLIDYRTTAEEVQSPTLPVVVDACASRGGSAPIAQYAVTIAGTMTLSQSCEVQVEVPGEGLYGASVEVRRADGRVDVAEGDVEVVDHLIVSLGDSVASGEGVPDFEIAAGADKATWVDRRCHRSAQAGPAKAALALERRDPRSSVTFVSLACSGAAVLGSDFASGGLLTPYEGLEPATPPLPPQLDAAKDLVGKRKVDSLFLSIGANDVKFSAVVKGCVVEDCTQGSWGGDLLAKMAELPDHYAQLSTALQGFVEPQRVLITDYFDPLRDEDGVLNMDCAVDGDGLIWGITRDEAQFAYDKVMVPLNSSVAFAAAKHGWTLVDGMMDAFAQHGYCARDSHVVQLGQSKQRQGDRNGAFHPNRAGHDVYAAGLQRAAEPMLPIVRPQTAPPAPEDPDLALQSSTVQLVYLHDGAVMAVPADRSGGTPVVVTRPTAGYAGDPRVAATPAGLVVTWTELVDPEAGSGGFDIRSARVSTLPPDLRVARVSAVQASSTAASAAAGKQVLAEIELTSTFDSTRFVDVEVALGEQVVVQRIAAEPGHHVVHVSDPSLVAPGDGELLTLDATVDPYDVVSEHDEANNTRSSRPLHVKEGRSLSLLFVSVTSSAGERTPCDAVRKAAEESAAYLRDAMPLRPDQVSTRVSCGSTLQATPVTPGGLDDARDLLHQAGRMAVTSGVDHVVGVTHLGYLDGSTDADRAVGLALLGETSDSGWVSQGALVDPAWSPTGPTTMHEVGHAFGLDHVEGVKAPGIRASTREVMTGSDLMASSTGLGQWVGPDTWDTLLRRLRATRHGLSAAQDASALAVSLRAGADGTVTAGAWEQVTGVTPRPLGTAGPLQLRYLDSAGEELATTGLPSFDVEALEVAGDVAADLGAQTEALAPWVDGTQRLEVLRDGAVVTARDVSSSAPEVTVSPPAASVAVGSTVDLSWTAQDPDGDSLTYGVDMSRDAGATWTPVLTGHSAQSASVPVDRSLGGSTLRFRVTASDGVRSGSAVSTDVSVPGVSRNGLIAFTVNHWNGPGWDVATVAPTGGPVNVLTSTNQARDPSWSPDGTRLVYREGYELWTMNADGSDRKLLLAAGEGISPGRECPAWSPDGTQIALKTDGALQVVRADGTDLRTLVRPVNYLPFVVDSCPAWSPDSKRLAVIGGYGQYGDQDHLTFVDVATAATTQGVALGQANETLDWGSDGLLVLKAKDYWGISLIEEDGTVVSRVARYGYTDDTEFRYVTISPDGTRVAGVQLTDETTNHSRINVTTRTVLNTDRFTVTDLRSAFPDTMRGAQDPDWQPVPSDEPPAPPTAGLAQITPVVGAVEGRPVTVDATSGLRPDGQVPSYTWDLDGDGEHDDAAGATAAWTPEDDGAHELGLKATLSDGTTDTAATSVTVANAPPVVSSSPVAADAGARTSLAELRLSDATGDDLRVDVDWGDGSSASGLAPVQGRPGTWSLDELHVWDAVGQVTASVHACDDDGACTDHDVSVTVADRVPEVASVAPASGPAGGGTTVELTGRFLDGTSSVLFGDTAGDQLSVVSDRSLIVKAPPLTPAAVVPVVVRAGEESSPEVSSASWAPLNDPPTIGVPTEVATRPDAPVVIPAAVQDAEDRPTAVVVAVEPEHGAVTVDGATATYVPDAGWSGIDVFALAADDGTDVGVPAPVRVAVGSTAPRPAGDRILVDSRSDRRPLADLLANDVDPDGDALTLVDVTADRAGSVLVDGEELVVQLPGGADSTRFAYTVEDPTGMRATTTAWVALRPTTSPAPAPAPVPPSPSPSPSPSSTPTQSPSPAPAPAGLAGFTAVEPVRVLDTRIGLGARQRPLGQGGTLDLRVTGGGVPEGATAVLLNVTAVGPTESSDVRAYPFVAGAAVPTVSNLNLQPGRTVAGLVAVRIGEDGMVRLRNARGSVHLVADLAGFYRSGSGSVFVGVDPKRLLDTRSGTGAARGAVGPGGVLDLRVIADVVPAGATAVALNVTAVGASAPTDVRVYPGDSGGVPTTSNVNAPRGIAVPNLVVVKVGSDGQVRLRNAAGHVHLIADLAGYYVAADAGEGYSALSPVRVLDTRDGTGGVPRRRVEGGGTLDLEVAGRSGVPADASSVLLTLTAVDARGDTDVRAYPAPAAGTGVPHVSNLNVRAGITTPNLIAVRVGDGGRVRLRSSHAAVHLIADLAGYTMTSRSPR